jgi:hypothetical protein
MTAAKTTRASRHARLSMECRRNRLEKRYRRLLLLYPAQHRREHGEEMLGVLLASAFDGHRVRSVADAADLVAAAARLRARAVMKQTAPVTDRRWSDALAVVSVIAPVLLIVAALAEFNVPQAAASALTGYPYNPLTGGFYIPDWPLTIGAPLIALLAATRLRRTAAMAAALTALTQLILLPARGASPALAFAVLLALTAAAALLLSEGPARGVRLLRWWGIALIAVAATILGGFSLGGQVVFSAASQTASGATTGFTAILPAEVAGLPADILIAGVLAVAGIGCLFTPVSRRVLALLAIPVIPYTIIWQDKLASDLIGQLSMISIPSSAELLYLPSLTLAAAIVAGTRVARRRRLANA